MKRKISVKNIVLALVMATLVFLIGISFGNFMSERKYSQFQDMVSDLRMQTMSMDLQYNLLAEDPCTASNTSVLATELSQLNSRLDYLERLYGTKDPEILRLKQYYSILQIQHWMLFRKAIKQCDLDYDLLLYFYSNDMCDECKTQGVVLTAFRKKYDDEVKVYAFDLNLNDPAVRTLIDLYGVETAPSIVYNDHMYPKFVPFVELEELRFNNGNETA